MQTIVVHCKPPINKKLTAIIGSNRQFVVSFSLDNQSSCPQDSKIVSSLQTRPDPRSLRVVHLASNHDLVRSSTSKVRAVSTLTEIVDCHSQSSFHLGNWHW